MLQSHDFSSVATEPPGSASTRATASRNTGFSPCPTHRLEVYRDAAETGYRSVTVHRAGETLAPLTRPAAAIAVGDLLPQSIPV